MRRHIDALRAPGLGIQLVLLVLALTLTSGSLVGALVTVRSRATLHDQIMSQSLATVDVVAAHVQEYVNTAENDARELAARPAIVNGMIDGDWDAVTAELERWVSLHPYADSAAVYTLDAVQRATGLPDKQLVNTFSAADRDWFVGVTATQQPYRGAPRLSSATNQPTVGYGVPLLDAHGQLRGVLNAPISLRLLSDMLRRIHSSYDGRLSLDDWESNVILAHVDPSRMLRPQSGKNAATAMLDAGMRGTLDNVNSQGEATLAAFGPVPGLPWGVMMQQPMDQAFAKIDETTRSAVVLIAVSLILATALATSMAVRIARPLRQLRAAAEAMAAGDLDQRTHINGRNEVGELARAFDHMAHRLGHTIGQLEQREAELAHRAFHDSLTDLPNRAAFIEQLRLRTTERTTRAKTLGLLFLDLDNFKLVNDGLGHNVGDRLLIDVAARLRAEVARLEKVTDLDVTVARLGGDEFTVVLDGLDEPARAVAIADRLLAILRTPLFLDGHEVEVGASLGLALLAPDETVATGELLRRADVAVYAAKRRGKARCVLYTADLDADAVRTLELAADLRHALARHELAVVYQPLVDLRTGAMTEIEALARWTHPRFGAVSPNEFVPLAEDTGLIVPIGRWVLEEACRQARAFQTLRPGNQPLIVNVNISARQLQPDADLVSDVRRCLSQTGLDPACLRLEITESVAVAEMDTAAELLGELRAMGVGLAIDDFGAGTSALGYFERFPIDTLKIDRSFVDRIGREPRATALVRSVVAFARELGLAVTGEGVETHGQMEGLLAVGCDRGQGYLFAHPVTAAELASMLASAGRPARAA